MKKARITKNKQETINPEQVIPSSPILRKEYKFDWRILFLVALPALVIASILFFSLKSRPVIRSFKDYPTTMVMPAGVDSAYIAKMNAFGFGNTENVRTYRYILARQKWHMDFQLHFIGDAEMTKFLADNFFIMGESKYYLETIPQDAGRKMIENFNRVYPPQPAVTIDSDEIIIINGSATSTDFGVISVPISIPLRPRWDEHEEIEIKHERAIADAKSRIVYVIAGAGKFDKTGMRIVDGMLKENPPPDPIAVIKVEDGWVELAAW